MSQLIQTHLVMRHVTSTGASLDNTTLSLRDCTIVGISTLVSMGHCTEQLNSCVENALKQGTQIEEILDLFQYAGWFAGNARALSALHATSDTLSRARKADILPEYTESLMRLGDHDTVVRDTRGGGVPIILIHALSLDSRMFKDVLPTLASSTGARVIAYDLRGHGYARGAPLTQSLEHPCVDLALLLDTLSIDKVDLYGVSYGGSVAQYFTLDYPDRVRSLGLIATFGKAPSIMITRAERAEKEGVLSLLAETMIRWFRPETIALNPWCVNYARSCVERARVEEWAAAWRAMSRQDNLARLEEVRVPVIALSGTHDASATPPIMKAIVSACKNTDAEFASVEQGAHMMAMEQPREIAERMAAFRKTVDERVSSAKIAAHI